MLGLVKLVHEAGDSLFSRVVMGGHPADPVAEGRRQAFDLAIWHRHFVLQILGSAIR